jgi:hypothetical protein
VVISSQGNIFQISLDFYCLYPEMNGVLLTSDLYSRELSHCHSESTEFLFNDHNLFKNHDFLSPNLGGLF